MLIPSHLGTAQKCGKSSGRDANKLKGMGTDLKCLSDPIIQGAAAHCACKVAVEIDAGDHTVFWGEVVLR